MIYEKITYSIRMRVTRNVTLHADDHVNSVCIFYCVVTVYFWVTKFWTCLHGNIAQSQVWEVLLHFQLQPTPK